MKLQWVKVNLRNWHKYNRSHISSRVVKAKGEWDNAQEMLDQNPSSPEARLVEKDAARSYHQLCRDEESYYKQKSRIQWLTLGDKNTSFFHRSLLHRRMRNQIITLEDGRGNVISNQKDMGNMAVNYYK
ncbi:hypothetical protein OIU79_028773 [Salix purpurea]|uniref:Uncharacterized protein n=1 Tax=Salix purpurea TaxID=77065 RepID=A0A9Q1A3C2_SALPP|nr:hypothetical protein OIU79_028773 [Salix purpurea]